MLYWATSRCCKCQSSCSQLLRSGALLGSFFPMVLLATRYRCSAWQFLPDGALRRPCHYAAVHLHLCHGASAILPRRPGQSLRHSALASNIFPMVLCHGGASHKALCHGAPASNKPHSAEKSTPVRLAIWRIWAGFANSQLRLATLRCIYIYMRPSPLLPPWSCCSDRRKSLGPSAPIAYATSVSPPNEAIAWPGAQLLGAG